MFREKIIVADRLRTLMNHVVDINHRLIYMNLYESFKLSIVALINVLKIEIKV